MPLNKPNTLASFFFTGLGVVEFNDQKQCTVGIVRCPDHDLTVDIFKITTDPATGSTSQRVDHHLDVDQDIEILLETGGLAPTQDASAFVVDDPPFDRANDTGDPNDFRWILDIQGEVQEKPLKRKDTSGETNACTFKPNIVFNTGQLYTEKKEPLKFALVAPNNPASEVPLLGSIAFMMGADVFCPPVAGNKIVIRNKGVGRTNVPTQDLPWEPNIRYEVKINNTCTPPNGNTDGTDFLVYSQVLEPVSGAPTTFDLRRVFQNNGNVGGRRVVDRDNLVVDSGQQACNKVRIGP